MDALEAGHNLRLLVWPENNFENGWLNRLGGIKKMYQQTEL
jgi:hypothetical protein